MFEFGVCAWLAPLVEEPANSKDPTAPTSHQRREDPPRRANWPQKLTKVEARETWRNGAALVEVDARSLPPPHVLTGSLG